MIFEWDVEKARLNLQKHGVSFEQASTVFGDPLALTFADPDHSDEEQREITIGHTSDALLVLVSHTDRKERIRIISARKATRREQQEYAKDQ